MAESKVVRTLVGKVVSNKMDKTIVVSVERQIQHAVYGKYIIKSKKYHAHDEENACDIGDVVQISEGRRKSKTKSWKLDKILEHIV